MVAGFRIIYLNILNVSDAKSLSKLIFKFLNPKFCLWQIFNVVENDFTFWRTFSFFLLCSKPQSLAFKSYFLSFNFFFTIKSISLRFSKHISIWLTITICWDVPNITAQVYITYYTQKGAAEQAYIQYKSI